MTKAVHVHLPERHVPCMCRVAAQAAHACFLSVGQDAAAVLAILAGAAERQRLV